jgi:tetratricopeptide (TPR) repeat protein
MSSVIEVKPKLFPVPGRLDTCLIILLFAATFIAYWPSLRGGVLWDDDAHITRPGLQSIGGLGRIWFQPGATQQYYPVLHTAFWVEHHVWGDSTLGYHVLNVVLHAVAACLFALILSQLSIRGAWVGAFIFALHPIGVESVAWISEQKNTLSAVFYLLAMLLYLRYDEQTGEGSPRDLRFTREYFMALACFVAAILSKSVTATLPAALLVIFWWKRGRLSWNRDVLPLLPWFGVAIAGGLFTAWVERRFVGAVGKDFSLSVVQRVLISGRDVWFYLRRLVWPSNLMFIYPRWDVNASVWWQYLFPAGVIALIAAAWLVRGRFRGPLAVVLFFVGSLFPALGFFNAYPFIYSFVADHFQYLASLGMITLAASFCRGKWRTAAAIVVIAVLGVLTRVDSAMYRDSETLYRTTFAGNPNCWMCYNNLGFVLFNQGRLEEALPLYVKALEIKPDYAEAKNNLGVVLSSQHRTATAVARFQEALQLKPDYPDALNNLANVLVTQDKPEEAMPYLQKALQLRPDYAEAKLNMGAALLKMNRIPDAITNLKDAVRLKPDYAEAHGILGVAWYTAGQITEARTEFEQAVRLKPNFAPPHRDLAEALWELGQPDQAIAQLETALRLDPNDEEAHESLGKVYTSKGRPAEAVAQFEEVLRVKPDAPVVHNDLALALEALKKPQDALTHFQEAIHLKPDYAEAHYNLGLLLINMGRRSDSINEFKATLKYDPNNAEAHDALGAALYDSGRFSEAVAEFSETQRLKPDLAGVQGNLELARKAANNGR